MSNFVDTLSLQPVLERQVLDDGFVRLHDVYPRLVPEGRTCEYSIVEAARVSYGGKPKTLEEDSKLVEYLMDHHHTSPLEHVEFSFHIRAPRFVIQHLLRHRTANVNEESQRYKRLDADAKYFHPTSDSEQYIRLAGGVNKQSSIEGYVSDETVAIFREMEDYVDKIIACYHKLVDHGVAKEVARVHLPVSMYSELYFKLDLNNLLKFLSLRTHEGAQYETRVFANAIEELITPLVPMVMKVYERRKGGLFIDADELESILHFKDLDTNSVSRKKEFEAKKKRLNDYKLPNVPPPYWETEEAETIVID